MSIDKPRNLLLVEDEALIALAEKRTLERYGFGVVTVMSGEAAVGTVNGTHGIDLVLMDINLGKGMDGTQAATRILEKHDLPLVFLSSHTEREVVERTEGITSYGYIVKNSGETVLIAVVKMAFKLFESKMLERARNESLHESGKKYRQLIENSRDIIYTLSAEGTITFVSPAWTTMLGHPVCEMVGRPFEEFVHPDDVPACRSWMRTLVETGVRTKEVEYRVRHANGTWRWQASSVDPLLDASGAVVGFEGVARDITEALAVKSALALEKKFVDAIFDSVPGMLYLYDAEGRLVRWNHRHETMTGYGPDELSRMHLMDWYADDPDSQRAVTDGLKSTAENGFGEAEAMLQTRSGSAIPMHFTAVPIIIDGKQYFTGIGTDITERKKLREALLERETLYRTLFEVLPVGLTVSDAAGTIVDSNALSERILGLSKKEHADRTVDGTEWRIVRRDRSPMPADEYASVKALKEGRRVENVEMGIDTGGGEITWIDVSATPIPIKGYGVVIAYIDITERTRAELMVESLLREKDLILKETHHRIKNNMGTISSLLLLRADSQENETCRDILNDAAGSVHGMMLLYDQLYRSENFDNVSMTAYLPALVDQIVGIFNKGSRVRVEVRVDDFVLGAKALSSLGILLNELITNSMKYAFGGAEQGLIRVSAAKRDSTVSIEYEDNGPGLPEPVARENSLGFGMQLINLLVRQLGGDIRIDQGGGAKYVITFQA